MRSLASLALLVVLGCGTGNAGPLDVGADAGRTGSSDAASGNDATVDYDATSIDAAYDDAFVADDAERVEDPPDPPEPDPEPEPEAPDPESGPEFTVVQANYRVLHWNIAGGKENDCRPDLIARAVPRFVRDRRVDFVGLNEICRSQYDAIRAGLRDQWGKTREFSAFVSAGGRVGNAIFSRFDLTQITRHKVGEDRYGDRNLLCGRLRTRTHLRFCAVHLSPNSSARTQLDRVMTRIETWWENQRDTVILAGDFNLDPYDRAFNAVYSRTANHPNNPDNRGEYREVDDADRAHCISHGERTSVRPNWGPCDSGRKIDFIFMRENRIVGSRYNGDALNTPNDCTGACSDHRPLFGTMRVRVRED